ncbi:MAG: hypothetical protein GX131_04645 [candidate division WS1 bacterium]|jgi:hypothetical protein|nr:hypothetical protein [candidate division WS1 bacterium]
MDAGAFAITIDGDSAQVRTAAELVVALDVLQGNHDRAVLEQLRPHLSSIIADARGLHATLAVLAPEDKTFLIEAIGTDLRGVIGSGSRLRDILASLGETEVEEALLRTLGADGLRTLIASPTELAEVLEWVYDQCDELALDLLGADWLQRMLRTGQEMALVLRSLDRPRQHKLIEMIGFERVPALLMNELDLAHMLRALPSELSCPLLEQLPPERLRELVRDARDWAELEPFLEADERDYLLSVLEVTPDAE